MKRISLFLLLLLSVAMISEAINVQRVSQGDVLNRKANSAITTMYIIEGDCSLSGDVSLAPGSILKFEGGMISGSGTIKGSRLMIDAPKYQIFGEDVSFVKDAIANGEVSAHWWGAKGDGKNYDCGAINRALQAAGTSWVVLDNLKYLTNETITLGEGQKLRCDGTISYRGSGAAIELTKSYVDLKINKLYGVKKGSGVLFSGNVYHGNININEIVDFNYGLNFTPIAKTRVNGDAFAGTQYCDITWQSIRCNTGIFIDLWSKENLTNSTVWVNENQFNGGRLLCANGIVVAEKKNNLNSYTADLINGNVFNCIGFEGWGETLIKPITLRHAWYNEFHDLRMSESLNTNVNVPLIEMDDCGYNTMNIKSIVPYQRIKAVNCNNIEFQGSFTDLGSGFHKGYDRLYIVNTNTAYRTPVNTKEGVAKNETHKLLSSRVQSRNIMNSLYLGRTAKDNVGSKVNSIGFNDLFAKTSDGTMVLSDVVEIGIYDNSQLIIDVANSIAGICPEVEMRCNIGAGSQLVVKNGTKEIGRIEKVGSYRITFDEARNVKLVKMTE